METVITKEKTTKQIKAHSPLLSISQLTGYEMHMGETSPVSNSVMRPFIIIERAGKKVYIEDGGVNKDFTALGTYIHGILDNDALRRKLLNTVRERKGLKPIYKITSYDKEFAYNRLANIMQQHLNINLIYKFMGLT